MESLATCTTTVSTDKTRFNIICSLRLGLPSSLLPSDILTKTLHAPLLSPTRAIHPVVLPLDLVSRISAEEVPHYAVSYSPMSRSASYAQLTSSVLYAKHPYPVFAP